MRTSFFFNYYYYVWPGDEILLLNIIIISIVAVISCLYAHEITFNVILYLVSRTGQNKSLSFMCTFV